MSQPKVMLTKAENGLDRRAGNPSQMANPSSEVRISRSPFRALSISSGSRHSTLVPKTKLTKGNRRMTFLATSVCCIMQPQMPRIRSGSVSFRSFSAPMLARSRFSAWSRTQHVLNRITLASSLLSAGR